LFSLNANPMQITHRIDDFLYAIFPNVRKGDLESLNQAINDYYTIGGIKPKVTIEDGFVSIELDVPAIVAQKADFRNVIRLCEQGRYSEAKPILNRLIQQNPTDSEYHRILGQILSDEGDQDEAINSLIEALRWDPTNGWALLMMGNIFSKFKNDIPTALVYYNQALIANPEDYITMNNIGASLMQKGETEAARMYLNKALEINDQYSNTHFALGTLLEKSGNHREAFEHYIKAIKVNPRKDVLLEESVKSALSAAKKIVEEDDAEVLIQDYKMKLETQGERVVMVVPDESIATAAKFELAENYHRETHTVRYKPDFPAVEHLVMHELVHLDFILQARKEHVNRLFISNEQHKRKFLQQISGNLNKLRKRGIPEERVTLYTEHLFTGLNSQTYNTPIDLFIEDFLHSSFERLRPFQFLSMYVMLQDNIKAVTDAGIVDLAPPDILSKSRIYNIINALQFKELYGIDSIHSFKPNVSELKQAEELYQEFKEYQYDRSPGEEYELLQNWARDLKLNDYFDLVDEDEYRNKGEDLDSLIQAIERDPLGLETNDSRNEEEMQKFLDAHKGAGINLAVVMYMVEALRFFEGKGLERIKEIAFEIAMLGTQGIKPENKDYRISAMPSKKLTGFQVLAYYYVSWAIAIPEMLEQLEMPYAREYELAQTLFRDV